MLVVALIALWAFGLFSGLAIGGLIHILLAITLIALLLRLVTGRRIAAAT